MSLSTRPSRTVVPFPRVHERGSPRRRRHAVGRLVERLERRLCLSFTITDVAELEGNAGTRDFVFAVEYRGSFPAEEPISALVETTDDTATAADGDYQAKAEFMVFTPAARSRNFRVTVNGDAKFEPHEAFFVDVSDDLGGQTVRGTGTVQNDDTTPTMFIGHVTAAEGNAGATNFVFPVMLTNPTYLPASARWTTFNGTASGTANPGGSFDFASSSAFVGFSPGQTSATVNVSVFGDVLHEPTETFFVRLSEELHAFLSDSLGLGTIVNDDPQPPPNFVIGTDGNDTLVVNASGPDSGSYSLNGGPAVTFSGVSSFTFQAERGDDLLRINNPSGGLFAPADGITYHGGGSFYNDRLEVQGGSSAGGTYSPGPTLGAGTVTHAGGAAAQTIRFTGLTLLTDAVPEAIYTVNGTRVDSETISLDDGAVAGDGLLRLTIAPFPIGPFPPVQFANKTNVVVEGDAQPGPGSELRDRITVNFTEAATGLAAVTFNAGAGIDNTAVLATAPGVTTTVNCGGNVEEVYIGAPSFSTTDASLDRIRGPLTVRGEAHPSPSFDTLHLVDDDDTDPNTYVLSGSSLTRNGTPLIQFDTFENITFNAGSGANAVTVVPSSEADIRVHAADPAGVGSGDVLTLDAAGVTDAMLHLLGIRRFTFGNRRPVFFSGIESFDAVNGTYALPLDLAAAGLQNGEADEVRVLHAADGGSTRLRLHLNGSPFFVGGGVQSLALTGSSDAETVVLDFGSGVNVIPAGSPAAPGILFDGGGGVDGMVLRPGYAADTIGHVFDRSAADGSVNVDGRVVRYAGLEAAAGLSDQLAASHRLFTLGDAADTILLDDGAAAGDGFSRIRTGTGTSLPAEFLNPLTSLTINGGAGADSFNFPALGSPAATATIRLNGDGAGAGTADGADTFSVAPNPTWAFQIDGGDPLPPASPGDRLGFDLAGVTGTTFTPSGAGAGTFTFSNRRPVNFTRLEQFPDYVAPTVVVPELVYQSGAPHRLRYRFSEPIDPASLQPADLTLSAVPTGPAFSPVSVSYDAATQTATFTFAAGFTFPNGNYRATLSGPGVTDAAGNAMAGDHVFDFFFLTGDVNRDRFVNGTDFAILAGNFGKTGMTYAQGDLNGDGNVNGSDFALLAGNFGRAVPQPQPAVALASRPTAGAATARGAPASAARAAGVKAAGARRGRGSRARVFVAGPGARP
jgi:Calx-beta domain/Dockerin type I domain